MDSTFSEKITYKMYVGFLCPESGAVKFNNFIYRNIFIAMHMLDANNGEIIQNPLHKSYRMANLLSVY